MADHQGAEEQCRAEFERWYIDAAFDLKDSPIGSRDASLQWKAWQAAWNRRPTPASDLRAAAQAVIDRWDSPKWKDQPHTAECINGLRKALEAPAAGGDGRVPLTKQQIDDIWLKTSAEVAKLELAQRYTFAAWLPIAVRLTETAHGILPAPPAGKEGGAA